jgi:hypothetical protein
VRRMAQQTGLSKSRGHRLTQAMERRHSHPESGWWETAEGRPWLTRLGVATLETFGLTRGGGMETRPEVCARLPLAPQGGCSPSAWRRVRQKWEEASLATAATWEQEGGATGEGRAILGAVEATFLARRVLVLLDLPPGSVGLAAAADERRSAPWYALVEKRLATQGAQGRALVSDRAKALIQRAAQGLACLRLPDVLPLVPDLVPGDALALGRRRKPAPQEWHKAEAGFQKPHAVDPRGAAEREATPQGEAKPAAVTRWEARQPASRQRLATLSLTLHPCGINEATPQTSLQVEAPWPAPVTAMDAGAATQQFPARPAAMTTGKKPWPALAALGDCWWAGVGQAWAQAARAAPWRIGARAIRLPWVYGEHRGARTRCARRKATMPRILALVRAEWATHALTRCLPPQALEDWQAWATDQGHALQRAASAVEGRNGCLAPRHHQQRGWPTLRDKGWTVRHHCDGHAADGTTPASRFFRRPFPELFATVFSHIEALPQPRRRTHQVALSH